MKATITKTSEWHWEDTKTFKTLKELQDFIQNNGNSVVIQYFPESNRWEVEIYDGYRE